MSSIVKAPTPPPPQSQIAKRFSRFCHRFIVRRWCGASPAPCVDRIVAHASNPVYTIASSGCSGSPPGDPYLEFRPFRGGYAAWGDQQDPPAGPASPYDGGQTAASRLYFLFFYFWENFFNLFLRRSAGTSGSASRRSGAPRSRGAPPDNDKLLAAFPPTTGAGYAGTAFQTMFARNG